MSRSRRGFTLIELLVVMGIIVLLVALSMPVVGWAWEAAYQTRCKANLSALAKGCMAFANDHEGHLPGARLSYWADRNPDHWDWIYGQYSISDDPNAMQSMTPEEQLRCAPQFGTIFRYVGGGNDPKNPATAALALYRCPSLRQEKVGSGIGSNGRYDYFYFSIWSGAAIKDIKPISQMHYPANNPSDGTLVADSTLPWSNYGFATKVDNRPTPMIAQEDSRVWGNTVTDYRWWTDRYRQMTHIHSGGSYYAGTDGGVYFVNEPDTDISKIYEEGASLWFQNGPLSKVPVRLNLDPGASTNPALTNTDGLGWGRWSRM